MSSAYSITQAQAKLPRLLKEVVEQGAIAITRRNETIAYLVSRERMETITETLEVLGDAKAMKAIRAYEAGNSKFLPLTSFDEED